MDLPVPQVLANGLRIEYESFGSARHPAIVLIMGLAAQLTRWPLPLCDKLVARGYRVIRFDNRDVGLSSKLDDAQVPVLGAIVAARMTGLRPSTPYSLDDMAADAIGLLDALHIRQAHVAGVSMGGMIAQQMAAEYPQRVSSLSSIMSTTGNPALPHPSVAAAAALMSRPPDPAHDLEGYLAHSINTQRVLASPAFAFDEAARRQLILTDLARCYYPAGYARQFAAVVASGDRRSSLRRIGVPTVVIHGADDPLVPVTAARDTAENIAGAELRIIPGMGHELPPQLFDTFADAIDTVARRATPQPA